MNITYNKSINTISITGTSNADFNKSGDIYALTFINLKRVKVLNYFTYTVTGETDYKYLTTEYRISKDGDLWSNWFSLDETISNFPLFDPKYDLFIEIKWIRSGESNIGEIHLTSYELSGIYYGDTVVRDFSGNSDSIIL